MWLKIQAISVEKNERANTLPMFHDLVGKWRLRDALSRAQARKPISKNLSSGNSIRCYAHRIVKLSLR